MKHFQQDQEREKVPSLENDSTTPMLSYPQYRDAVASKNNDNLAQSLEIARFEGLNQTDQF